jgi:hypothetical protein
LAAVAKNLEHDGAIQPVLIVVACARPVVHTLLLETTDDAPAEHASPKHTSPSRGREGAQGSASCTAAGSPARAEDNAEQPDTVFGDAVDGYICGPIAGTPSVTSASAGAGSGRRARPRRLFDLT